MSEDLLQTVKIGTRGSALALYQANLVADLLRERLDWTVELVVISTSGDQDRSRSVADMGVVGVFVKELEKALLGGEVDLAVHSLKDLPTDIPGNLMVAAQPERVTVNDLLIANPQAWSGRGKVPLERGAKVGTASQRRRAQLLAVRPDLEVVGIRGNVPTRIEKIAKGEVDAVVLAKAGVSRLEVDFGELETRDLPLSHFLPAPGQGALGIEVRRPGEGPEGARDRAILQGLQEKLHDEQVARATETERELLHRLGAGCSVPLGTLAKTLPYGPGPGESETGVRLQAVLGPEEPGPQPVLRQAHVVAASPAEAAELALRVLAPRDLVEPDPEALQGKRILIARDPERGAELASLVAAAGGQASCHAPLRTFSYASNEEVEAAVDALPLGLGWIVFASAQAVPLFTLRLSPSHQGKLHRFRFAAVGPATARAVAAAGLPLEVLGTSTGADLARQLADLSFRVRPHALLPAAVDGRPELAQILSRERWEVTRLPLYASMPNPALTPADLEGLDAVLFASPAGARSCLVPEGGEPLAWPEGLKAIAIGPTTGAALAELGLPKAAVVTAESPTPAGQFAALVAACGPR